MLFSASSSDPPRKHVRFNPVTQRRFSDDFDHFRPDQLITTGASSGPKSILATSRTFPVSVLKQRRPSMDAEAVRDFLERSNSTSTEVGPLSSLKIFHKITAKNFHPIQNYVSFSRLHRYCSILLK